jgi:nicotinate-nucleotide pyrophosphorylase (carboxylating)
MNPDPWLAWPLPLRESALALLKLALDEDLGSGDVTARHFGGGATTAAVRLVAREPGVLAGLPLFLFTFRAVAARLELAPALGPDTGLACPAIEFGDCGEDGRAFEAGQVLAHLSAPEPVLHGAERTALNFLQRLSAVATATARATALSSGPALLDTRKTTPGYRLLEKHAVRMGGGRNHRLGLFDAAMVKDNHKEALGGMAAVMERAGDLPGQLPLIVEVDDLAELEIILAHESKGRVERILLDNFDPDDVTRALALRAAAGGGPDFEISGGLVPEDLADPRYAGVEAASLGSITHSAGVLDLALELEQP